MNKNWIIFIAIHTLLQGKEPINLQEGFTRVSRSILVVHSINQKGEQVALGSGVVVAPNEVVTNAHVVLEGTGAFLTKGLEKWIVKEILLDPKLDLALLKLEGLPLPPVKLCAISKVKVGQKLFVVGNPKGLELSLSDGVVSALRSIQGILHIQTTAPISPGSSGGGAFNANCELIGIPTFAIIEGQNLNFAISSQYIPSLQSNNINLKQAKFNKIFIQNDNFIKRPTLEKMSNIELSKFANANNPIAEEILGFRFEYGIDLDNESKQINLKPDIYRSTYWYNRSINHGNNSVASRLNSSYVNGIGRNKNFSEAKRIAWQMIKNIDTNYDINTNAPYTFQSLRAEIKSAAFVLLSTYIAIDTEERQIDNAMEILVWAEILATLEEEDLATSTHKPSNQIQSLLENQTKESIAMRNKLYEFLGQQFGTKFQDEARVRANALLRGYALIK